VTRRDANEAPEAVLDAERADGPEPLTGAAASHSGRLLVRMPKSLHAELSRASEREGTSLNSYIVAALSASVAWRRPDGEASHAPAEPAERSGRLSVALTVNFIVLAVVAITALALLITAWQS
jgi:hypothetical protein